MSGLCDYSAWCLLRVRGDTFVVRGMALVPATLLKIVLLNQKTCFPRKLFLPLRKSIEIYEEGCINLKEEHVFIA